MVKLGLLPVLAIVATFTHTVSLGSLLVEVTVAIGTVIAMIYGVKYRVVADQQGLTIDNLAADRDTWKDVAETRARELEAVHAEKQEILGAVSALKEEKARLEALPNLSIIVEQMSKEAERASSASKELFTGVVDRFAEIMEKHEKAAATRHTDLIAVLGRELGQKPK